MKKKTTFVTAPALQEEWDEQFEDKKLQVSTDDALCYESGQHLPAYALYAPQGLTFYREDHTPYLKGKDGKPEYVALDPCQRRLVELRLEQMLRTEVCRDGQTGILIPLKESPKFRNAEDVNAYLHNLMFWESLLPPETCGPLMQHINWLVQKLYELRQRKPKPDVSSWSSTSDFNGTKMPAAVAAAYPPIAASPVALPTVQGVKPADYVVVDYPSVAARAVTGARALAQARALKRGRVSTKSLGTLAAKRQAKRMGGVIERVLGKGGGSKEMYRTITEMLEKQSPGLRSVLTPKGWVKEIPFGKGQTAIVFIPKKDLKIKL